MALNARDVPITRDDIAGWLSNFTRASNLPNFKTPIEDYLAQQIASKALPDLDVNTIGHDDLGEATPILTMILNDLPSYGFGD